MLIDEKELIYWLKRSKNVLLVNPQPVKNYPPLGLMKIASFVKSNGGVVHFSNYYISGKWDLICVATLFTYDSRTVFDCLDSIKFLAGQRPVIIGGIFSSILPKVFEEKYQKMMNFTCYSKTLDSVVPDYSIDWKNDPEWNSFCFLFTQRGCINNCAYCAVKKIEPERWVNPDWRNGLIAEKPHVAISDNHILSCGEHFYKVIETIKKSKYKVLFNNGLDNKYITKENAKALAGIKYIKKGLRLAFDRIEEDGTFQAAIEMLLNAGCHKSDIEIYCMYNFNDTPQEANYRCSECYRLGVQQYPIPYRPFNKLSRQPEYIGKHWTHGLVRAFREYWLFGSNYRSKDINDFLREDAVVKKFNLTKGDYEKWEYVSTTKKTA